jgi:hypothetical protein
VETIEIDSEDNHAEQDDDCKELESLVFSINELQVFVDPDYNFEWKFIDVKPDLRAIFQKLNERFFQGKLSKIKVAWCRNMGSDVTSKNYNDEDGAYTIGLNEKTMCLKPRIDLLSVLFHEMIHALLKTNNVKEEDSGHGPNFRAIMLFLNQKLMTRITTSHRVANLGDEYKTHWYR